MLLEGFVAGAAALLLLAGCVRDVLAIRSAKRDARYATAFARAGRAS